MKRLFLVRHAHADDGHHDHERALSPRGEQAAISAGDTLAEEDCEPQLALLSTAVRVTQTWQLIQERLPAEPRVETDSSLYLADVDSMYAQLVSIPASVECALLVAHNPGISQLASWLAATGPDELLDRLQRGFAPAAVAALSFRVSEWSEIGANSAEVCGFWD